MRAAIHLTPFDVSFLLVDLFSLIGCMVAGWAIWGYLDQNVHYYDVVLKHLDKAGLEIVVVLVSWPLIFYSRGLYHPRTFRWPWWQELSAVAVVTAMGLLFAAVLLLFSQASQHGVPLLVFGLIFLGVDFFLRRLLKALLVWADLESRYRPRVLILGSGPLALRCMAEAQASGQEVVGYLDLHPRKDGPGSYLGGFGEFPRLLREQVIDKIVVAMPLHAISRYVRALLHNAHQQGLHVVFPFSQLFGVVREDVDLEDYGIGMEQWGSVEEEWNLVLYSTRGAGRQAVLKRILDVTGSLILLVVFSPVMAVAALAIWTTMGSPILFRQQRLGYHGRRFWLYKFRTMVPEAEALQDQLLAYNERGGAAFKMTDDPRVTPVGRILRKTNIDELPQLLNVLRGEMSLVGPRPLPLKDYERMGDEIYRFRLSVLPGLTGPWQVSDRDRLSFEEWMQMEIDYARNWSLWLDIKILLLTIPVFLSGRGAK